MVGSFRLWVCCAVLSHRVSQEYCDQFVTQRGSDACGSSLLQVAGGPQPPGSHLGRNWSCLGSNTADVGCPSCDFTDGMKRYKRAIFRV